MKLLVTAGNTLAPIDQVRAITNIFTGRTGAKIALHAHARGHSLRLLTSHPEVVDQLRDAGVSLAERWEVAAYQYFGELQTLMADGIVNDRPDAVIHCAAVNDYQTAGIYALAPGTRFRPENACWEHAADDSPALLDRAAGKVKSDEPELWLRLVRSPKLVDFIRPTWGFRGVLVKFKLEVGVGDAQLLAIAEGSRRHSGADLMVANTQEGAYDWAFLGSGEGTYQRIARSNLPRRLLDEVERLHQERVDG